MAGVLEGQVCSCGRVCLCVVRCRYAPGNMSAGVLGRCGAAGYACVPVCAFADLRGDTNGFTSDELAKCTFKTLKKSAGRIA